MRIAVIGTGYVGLVTGTCFADVGNHVACVDVDEAKLTALRKGVIPIFEPGLEPMVIQACELGFLTFTSNLAEAIADAEIIFIAVGTPSGEDGSADLKYVLQVARQIGDALDHEVVVVDKSTVPVGTAEKVRKEIASRLAARKVDVRFEVVSNPEFLKEGDAVSDFMKPDRVIIGAETEWAQKRMAELYAPFSMHHNKIQVMGVRDAEMTKYAANAMLATKISFMNEIANLCEALGVDVENVRRGIGSDQRIGYAFIYPGCGYGGSCFPKDVKAIIHMAEETGYKPNILHAVEQRNVLQKHRLAKKVKDFFGEDLTGLKIGIWGLAFKPGTDDTREAPAITLIEDLLAAGATVLGYDPVAKESIERTCPAEWFSSKRVQLVDRPYDALEGVDAMVLVTEWKLFRQPDFTWMKKHMKQSVIFDGRNQYDPKRLSEMGFKYFAIGRGESLKK